MLSPVVRAPGLVTGERLTVEEFLRRWEELPKLKNAELIDGVVLLPGPSRQSESTSFGECSKMAPMLLRRSFRTAFSGRMSIRDCGWTCRPFGLTVAQRCFRC
jgi:hypothetical protein